MRDFVNFAKMNVKYAVVQRTKFGEHVKVVEERKDPSEVCPPHNTSEGRKCRDGIGGQHIRGGEPERRAQYRKSSIT